MVAKSLIKLVDEAVLPALLLIIAKVLGLLLATYFFRLHFNISLSVLPHASFTNLEDYILAENYSNLTMFTAAAVGMLTVLLRAHLLHASHIKPNIAQKLTKINLDELILSSYHLYHKASVWLTLLWLTTAFLAMSTLAKVTYAPITAIAIIVSLNFSWILARDIQREMEIAK